jgi:hypothetical protein
LSGLGLPIVAFNDACRLVPKADILYACDAEWWEYHKGCAWFAGEKWSLHNVLESPKLAIAEKYGVNLIRGEAGEGFCTNPAKLHYGSNSGFQGINLACHLIGWAGKILLFGFDMRRVEGKSHFFGEHPPELRPRQTDYQQWFREFNMAAKMLPDSVQVLNCTPNSALPSFPRMDVPTG